MKTGNLILAASAIVAVLAGCNRLTPAQMAKNASDVQVNCEPQLLFLSGEKVDAVVTLSFPKGYFNPNALMEVTPVLVYADKELSAPTCFYQGEKVTRNNTLVPSDGTKVTERLSFPWKDGMETSRLELRGVVKCKGKQWALPTLKIADGVSSIYRFANLEGVCSYKSDEYQEVIHRTTEGKILYDVNSSVVKSSQLKSMSMMNYQDRVRAYSENERYEVKGTEIVSYTSPEGGKKLNDKLSDNRSEAASKAWRSVGSNIPVQGVEVQSIGQDWEGFKEAVEKSDLPDKDLILRVLSMYSDPSVRESEIRNLSAVYSELKGDVFPQLRRTRFVTHLDFRNYSIEDLKAMSEQKIYMIDEEGLLKLASVTEDSSRKEFLYNFTMLKFNSKRAAFNLAVQAYKEQRYAAIDFYLGKLDDEEDPAVINLRGLRELQKKEWYKAEDLFEKAGTDEALANRGVVNMLQCRYEKAAAILPDSDVNKAVALLILGRNEEASKAVTGEDAVSEYLRAVIAARAGKVSEARKHMDAAVSKDSSLSSIAQNDIEFAKCRNN